MLLHLRTNPILSDKAHDFQINFSVRSAAGNIIYLKGQTSDACLLAVFCELHLLPVLLAFFKIKRRQVALAP